MRAVALADETVQDKIAASYIPLKVAILPGTKELALDWPAVKHWKDTYLRMGGETCEGFTCCSVVSRDLQVEYGNTGSAFVWEMFDSIAYDAEKFAAMLDRGVERAEEEQAIVSDESLNEKERDAKLAEYRKEMQRAIGREGRFHLPPWGFSIEGAKDLFKMTGDLAEEE